MRNFWKLNRLVVLFISFGFLVLSFEICLQHYDQLSQKTIMWTPVVFGLVGGFIGILITILFNRVTYYLFFVLMGFSIFTGVLGLVLHNRWRFSAFIDFFLHQKSFPLEILTIYCPLFAPSAFIGIACLGILVAIFQKWPN